MSNKVNDLDKQDSGVSSEMPYRQKFDDSFEEDPNAFMDDD